MNFSFFTPFAPRTRVPLFGGVGVGGGSQNCFAYSGCCVWIWTRVQGNFFLLHGPRNPWRGSRVRTPGTLWSFASEDLAVFTLDKAAS